MSSSIPSYSVEFSLNSYSLSSLNRKKDTIGYYKKDDHTYVLTTRTESGNAPFIAKIDKIANLLNGAAVSKVSTSAQHTIQVINYVDSVYKILQRHNAKMDKIKEQRWFKVLARIPLISRLVHWIFKGIQPPDEFLKRYFVFQAEPIRAYLSQAPDLNALIQRKDELLSWSKEQQQLQDALRGMGHQSWEQMEEVIQAQYKDLVIDKFPPLQLARKLLQTSCADPKTPYREILYLTEKDDIPKAIKACEDTLKSLNCEEQELDESVKSIADEAKVVVIKACRHFFLQPQPIHSYLSQATTIDDLLKRKEALGQMTSDLRSQQNRLGGAGVNDWDTSSELIEKEFTVQVVEKIPALKVAQKLVSIRSQDPDRLYREILHLSDDEEVAKAPDICNAVLKSLHWDYFSLRKYVTEEQRKMAEEAKALAVKAYGQWHVQRICRQKHKSLPDLLGTTDPAQFVKKFKSLYDRMRVLDMPSAQEAVEILCNAYSQIVKPPYEKLAKDLDNDQPIFKGINSLSDLLTHYNTQIKILEDWHQYTVALIQGNESRHKKLVEGVNFAYYKQLGHLVPIFHEAASILNIHVEPSTNKPGTNLPLLKSSATTLESERWYVTKMNLFTFEMAQLDADALSPQAWNILRNARQKLMSDLAKVQEKMMVENLKRKANPSFFERGMQLFAGIFGEDKGKEQPLKLYREDLVKLLDSNFKNDPELERIYQRKLGTIIALPNSESMKTLLENAYCHYQRARQIQPLLTEVATSWILQPSISLEDALNRKNLATNILETEKSVNALQDLLDEEIKIQGTKQENPLLPTLQKAKSLLLDSWGTFLEKSYPQMKVINKTQKIQVPAEGLYKAFLGIQSGVPSEKASAAYEKLSKMIKIESADAEGNKIVYPLIVQEAYVEAGKKLLYAYKEWEADRILSLKSKDCDDILGVSWDTPKEDKVKRWRQLWLLLHPDKSSDASPKIKDKILRSNKLLPDSSAIK